MRSFLEHFAFIVFLFVCVSHYVANAEIHIYPASLESFALICSLTAVLQQSICELVYTVVEHLRAPPASAITSSSLVRVKTVTSCVILK